QLLDDARQIVAHEAAEVEAAEPAVAVEAARVVLGDMRRVRGADVLARDLVDVRDVEGAVVGEVKVALALTGRVGRELGLDLEEVLFVGEGVLLAVLRAELAPPDVEVI